MKKLLLLSMALIYYDAMLAQVSPPRAVLASIGKDAVVCDIAWSYTVGEAVINSYSNCNLRLTQGFQQPDIADCSGHNKKPEQSITIFPNPAQASSLLTFLLPANEKGTISISIFNAEGKIAKSMILQGNKSGTTYSFHPQLAAAGMYRVAITTNDAIYNGMFLISN